MNTVGLVSSALFLALAAGCPAPSPAPDVVTDAVASDAADASDASLCPPNPSPSAPGGPCQCDSDCAMGGICGDEIQSGAPGGACLLPCPVGSAPAGFGCLRLAHAQSTLVPLCGGDAPDCRDGYACEPIVAGTNPVLACASLCTTDAQCTQTGHCDLYTGLCVPTPTGATLGAPCTTSSECRSDDCHTPPTFPGGACLSPCDVRSGVCPENGVCFASSSNPAGTQFGFCFPSCTDSTNCRTGYRCVDVAAGALGCVPMP